MNVMSGTAASTVEITAMVARRTVGYSLDAAFYTSREVYDLDIDAIFKQHWLFVGTEAEIPEPGDFVTVDVGTASVILVRDDDEEVRALHNVCRHRGSRILDDPCGSVGNLVCPYHQWTYRADGTLIFAESQPKDFDRSRFGLKPVHVRTVEGLIFICLADEPPTDFDEVADTARSFIAPYKIGETKVAHQEDLIESGNWKLTMENNRECYHCDAGHPELTDAYFPFHGYNESDVSPQRRPQYERFVTARAHLETACARIGIPREWHRDLVDRPTGYMIGHLPLDGEGKSYSSGGKQVCAKLLGDITEARLGDLHLHLQPNAWFHFLGDHAVVFWVMPIAPDKTLVRTTWLVHPDAVEGVDYNIPDLTAVWHATNSQDGAFVSRAQRGVTDPGYVPGPYSLVEEDVDAFVSWYIGRLRAYLSPHHDPLGLLASTSDRSPVPAS